MASAYQGPKLALRNARLEVFTNAKYQQSPAGIARADAWGLNNM